MNLCLVAVMLVVVFFSIAIHEVAHGYAALALGDDTAKVRGRLTLNPIKHFEPIGTLCMIFCGIGWAKPVPVDARRFKNPKKGMAITALAGPMTNLILGIAFTVNLSVITWLYTMNLVAGFSIPLINQMSYDVYLLIVNSLYIALYYNLIMAVFNLLPLPPFDGSRIMLAFLPQDKYFKIMRYEGIIMLFVFLLVWMGFFTGIFEFFADLIIDGVSTVIYALLNALYKAVI